MNDDRSRQRLGRGLASLIGSGGLPDPTSLRPGMFGGQPETATVSSGERRIAIGKLSANPRNPRRNFDAAELAELAASIRTHGVVQPVLVRLRAGTVDEFEIVAGERRWRAAKWAGLADLPVVVREITDRESLEIAIIENVQRADLNAIEEAQAYEMLIAEHGYTQADLADVLGKSRSHVANTLRLLKLPDSVQAMVTRGEISPGHARTAVSADDPADFARQIVAGGLTVREAEDLARGSDAPTPRGTRSSRPKLPVAEPVPTMAPEPAVSRQRQKDEDTAALERLLSETLGMRVEIRLPEDGGDIRIEYGNLEQLDEICRLLQERQSANAAANDPRARSF